MARKIIIAIQGLTIEEEKILIKYLEANNCSWWHWIENFWMINTDSTITIKNLTDFIQSISSHAFIVQEIVGTMTWASSSPEKSLDWLNENWKD